MLYDFYHYVLYKLDLISPELYGSNKEKNPTINLNPESRNRRKSDNYMEAIKKRIHK